MTEKDNGELRSLREVLNDCRLEELRPPSALLADMVDTYPHLRLFLTGGVRNRANWPAGKLSLRRIHDSIVASLAVVALEIECTYTGQNFQGLLEMIDTDLANDTVRWHPDWKRRERENRKLLS